MMIRYFSQASDNNRLCPIVNISMVEDMNGNKIEKDSPIKKVASMSKDEILTIKNVYYQKTSEVFYLEATTLGGIKRYKKVNVTAYKEVIIINQAPFFEEKLPSHKIELREED